MSCISVIVDTNPQMQSNSLVVITLNYWKSRGDSSIFSGADNRSAGVAVGGFNDFVDFVDKVRSNWL